MFYLFLYIEININFLFSNLKLDILEFKSHDKAVSQGVVPLYEKGYSL